MLTLVAASLLAIASSQTATVDRVRVNVSENLEVGRGAISFTIPSQWEHDSTRGFKIRQDWTYSRGSFSSPAPHGDEIRMRLSVEREVAPEPSNPKLFEQRQKTFLVRQAADQASFQQRQNRSEFSPVKVGDYNGTQSAPRFSKDKDNWKIHYNALLRNAKGEFVKVRMEAPYKDTPAYDNLFQDIINSIKIP